MRTNYILVDYENVQPTSLGKLSAHSFKVFVFVGAAQAKIPFELAYTLQQLGEDAQFFQISEIGPNALDFHIAFYIGELSAKDPEGFFHIISKDKGFDPLITHLRGRKIRVGRSNDVSEIPFLKASNVIARAQIPDVVRHLKSHANNRPSTEQTLVNWITTTFRAKITGDEVSGLVAELQRQRLIVIKDMKVTYTL